MPFCKKTLKAKRPVSPDYPKSLKTLGDHLRKKRLDLKLLQKDVAQKLGVDKTSIHNWERGHTTPALPIIPRLIEFLGYIPFETSAKLLSEKIKSYRRILGVSRKVLAKRLGIDPTTVARWERGRGKPCKELLEKVSRLLVDMNPNKSEYITEFSKHRE